MLKVRNLPIPCFSEELIKTTTPTSNERIYNGLYLCIFDDDEDIDGVEIGSYADYNALRDYIVRELESGKAGSEYPTFVLHSDCDGEWPVSDCEKLLNELAEISQALKRHNPVKFTSDWQRKWQIPSASSRKTHSSRSSTSTVSSCSNGCKISSRTRSNISYPSYFNSNT